MELSSKLENALVKYLQGLDWPDYFDPETQIVAGENDTDITGQYIRCVVGDSDQEYPLNTGNHFLPVTIELRTPVAEQTAADESSDDEAFSASQKAKHQAVAKALQDAIMISDLDSLVVAAGVELEDELSIFAIQDRRPTKSQDDTYLASGTGFTAYACATADL